MVLVVLWYSAIVRNFVLDFGVVLYDVKKDFLKDFGWLRVSLAREDHDPKILHGLYITVMNLHALQIVESIHRVTFCVCSVGSVDEPKQHEAWKGPAPFLLIFDHLRHTVVQFSLTYFV